MADNVAITAGSGTTIATEDEGSVHYQKVKLTASGSGTTEALSKAEDTAHSNGEHGIMALTVRQDSAAALGGTDGDYQPAITDANGRLHTLDQNSAAIKTAVELIDNAVDSNYLNVNVNAAGTDLAMNAGVLNAQTQRVTIATDDECNNFLGTIDADTSTLAASVVAHDSGDSGNPMKVGGKAHNFDGSAPGTAVTENDRVHFIGDVYGRQFVETAHPNCWKVSVNYGAAQTNTAIKAAPGAGLKLWVTDIVFSTDTAMNMKLVEDTAGAPVDVWELCYFAANGGMVCNLKTPFSLTANKDLGITSSAAGNHTITVTGFTGP